MNSQSENNTQQNSAMDMLRKKNTRTLSELEQIPYQPQVYAIPIEQRKRESKLLADAVEFQPKLYQMIERLATAEELSDHCINIQNIEAEYMEKTVREVVTENRKTAAQMQNLVEQAGKNQEQFILNCSETLSKSTETLDSTIEKLRRKILKIMIVANTVIHYHTVLHSAFKRAFKDGLIDSNPFDRIDRPKKNKFTGENYSEEELIAMLGLIRGDIIYPAVMLAGGLGLRRSEALGARWSRVDWEKKTILLDTKIIEYKENGKVIVEPVEEMKNKSSRRTLPLPDPVYEMLCEEREKQDLYRRMFKGSYNRKYDDYICVDQLGGLIRPNRVTQRFADLIRQYGLRKIRFHDLRHTFASILINQDVPLLNVSTFLGHSDLSTTANIYAHLDKSKKQESADVISSIFNKAKE